MEQTETQIEGIHFFKKVKGKNREKEERVESKEE